MYWAIAVFLVLGVPVIFLSIGLAINTAREERLRLRIALGDLARAVDQSGVAERSTAVMAALARARKALEE